MRILQVPTYISITDDKTFSKLITGYGLMTLDIAVSIARNNISVDLITVNHITKGKKYKGVNILRRGWLDIIWNIKVHDLYKGFRIALKNKLPFRNFLKMTFYYATSGYFFKLIKSNDYDIIHFHGYGYENHPLMQYCLKAGQKFLVTLHGLNSFSDSIDLSQKEKQLEKEFFKKAITHNIPVTVISSGIKNTILGFLGVEHSDNFSVITNGYEVDNQNLKTGIDLHKRYNLDKSVKILLCVGNLCGRKNQTQIIDAYSKLPEHYKKNLSIIFLGRDTTDGLIERQITELGLTKELKLCGNISRNEIGTFYKQADFNILASISEGFGLSIIEGYMYGLPSITFNDLDAIQDVYDEKMMLTVEERTDEALAEGIKKMMTAKWDKNYIKERAQRFSLDEMAAEYIEFYRKILNEEDS